MLTEKKTERSGESVEEMKMLPLVEDVYCVQIELLLREEKSHKTTFTVLLKAALTSTVKVIL